MLGTDFMPSEILHSAAAQAHFFQPMFAAAGQMEGVTSFAVNVSE